MKTPTTPDELLTLLCVNAYLLYRETICSLSPNQERLQNDIRNPGIGDLVMEISTIYNRERDTARIGVLLRIDSRPIFTPEIAAESGIPEEEIPHEQVFVIQTLSGAEYDWTNASFIKVKQNLRS
jgi:hypothetical protein